MSALFSNTIVFWGSVVSLSVLITGSCYYFLNSLTSSESEDDLKMYHSELKENGDMTDELAMKLILKIEQLQEKEYLKQNADLDKQRRAMSDHSSEEYTELCRETLIKKQIANQKAGEKVLSSFKISFEELNEKIKQISPEKLESLSLSLYVLDENEQMPSVEIAKEAYILYITQLISGLENIGSKYQNVSEAEINQQLIESMMLKIKIDDMIYVKYNTNDRFARIVLSQNHMFINDPDLKALKEKMNVLE